MAVFWKRGSRGVIGSASIEDLDVALNASLPERFTVLRITNAFVRVFEGDVERVSIERKGRRVVLDGLLLASYELDEIDDIGAWFAAALEPTCSIISTPLIHPSSELAYVSRLADHARYFTLVAPVGQPVAWNVKRLAPGPSLWQLTPGLPTTGLDGLRDVLVGDEDAERVSWVDRFGAHMVAVEGAGRPQEWAADPALPVTEFRTSGGAGLYVVAGAHGTDGHIMGFVDLPRAGVRAGGFLGLAKQGEAHADQGFDAYDWDIDAFFDLLADDDAGSLGWRDDLLYDPEDQCWMDRSPVIRDHGPGPRISTSRR